MTTEYLNNKVFESIIDTFQQSKRNLSKYEMILQDLSDTKKRKAIRNVTTERDEQVFQKHLDQYKLSVQSFESAHIKLASAFYTLSENIVRYAKFNLIDADDAIQEGVLICFEKIDRFDPSKGKAFNYMTTCILNHFRQLYRTARNYNELKKRYHDFLQIKVNTNMKRKDIANMKRAINNKRD